MQKGDEALTSISPDSHGHLVKIPINLEPHGIFLITICLFIKILILSGHFVCKMGQSLPRSASENAHNS